MTTTITVTGNAAADPDLRFTPNGTPVATFSLAHNRKKKTQDGRWEDAGTDWYKITCWQDLAHNVADSIVKGTRVIVSGRLEQRTWEDKEGNQRLSVEVIADELGPSLRWATATVDRNERSSSSSGGGGQAPPAAYSPEEEPFHSPDAFLIWEQY